MPYDPVSRARQSTPEYARPNRSTTRPCALSTQPAVQMTTRPIHVEDRSRSPTGRCHTHLSTTSSNGPTSRVRASARRGGSTPQAMCGPRGPRAASPTHGRPRRCSAWAPGAPRRSSPPAAGCGVRGGAWGCMAADRPNAVHILGTAEEDPPCWGRTPRMRLTRADAWHLHDVHLEPPPYVTSNAMAHMQQRSRKHKSAHTVDLASGKSASIHKPSGTTLLRRNYAAMLLMCSGCAFV